MLPDNGADPRHDGKIYTINLMTFNVAQVRNLHL